MENNDFPVCLVSMPWQEINNPSLAIGILRAVCESTGHGIPETYHGNLRWAEFLWERSNGEITPVDYHSTAQGVIDNIGEWVFAGTLNGDDAFGRTAFDDYVKRKNIDPGKAHAMRDYAGEFIDLSVGEILKGKPRVVGITTTFQQNAASLALADRIKCYAPETVIVFGGSNCDGVMGAAWHRNYPFIDYVVRGEGDEIFPQLLDALKQNAPVDEIPGLCWRKGAKSIVNTQSGKILPPARIPIPNYDDWMKAWARGPWCKYDMQPSLVMETSRGCWWGEAHQCTFCGLNGSLMQFRSKAPDQALGELTHLVKRHRVLDFYMSDNIIDNRFFTAFLPQVAELNWDLRIFYEVKSNLTIRQILALRDAGVVRVQPGIESLSSPVLNIMDKGVEGIRNVRTLRDCQSAGVIAQWNWLVGFPGELPSHYWPVISQLMKLSHLHPPGLESPVPIVLERFSPNFDRPELGFSQRAPHDSYMHVYSLPAAELEDIAYFFESDRRGVGDDVVDALMKAFDFWEKAYTSSTLTRTIDDEGSLHITDRRAGWHPADHHFMEPWKVAAYLELEDGRSFQALLSRLRDSGIQVDAGQLEAWLDDLNNAGLLFTERDRYLALATASFPVKVFS